MIDIFFVISLTILILILFGFPISATKQESSNNSNYDGLNINVTKSLNSSLAILCALTFLAAFVNIRISIIIVLFAAFRIIYMVIAIRQNRTPKVGKTFIFISFVSSLAVTRFIAPLIENAQRGNPLGLITHGNNDIALYVVYAQKFLYSGFHNSGLFLNFDLNRELLQNHYQITNVTLASFSVLSGAPVWKIAIPVMVFAISYALTSIAAMLKTFWREMSDLVALLLAFFCICIGVSTYIQSQYFLGQIFALGITASIISTGLRYSRGVKSLVKFSYDLISIVVLSVFAYPHLLLPTIAITFAVATLTRAANKSLNSKDLQIVLKSIVLGFLISILYLPFAFRLGIRQSNITAGWSLKEANPISFLFDSNLSYEIGSNEASLLWILLTFAIFAIPFYYLLKGDKNLEFLVTSISITTFVLTFLAVRGFDLNGYSSWKMISYFLPIILGLNLGAYLNHRKANSGINGEKKVLATILISLSTFTGFHVWNVGYITTTKSELDLLSNPNVQNQSSLALDLQPYFQTMQAVALLDKNKLMTVSESYWPQSVSSNACILSTLKMNPEKFDYRINSDYGLIGVGLQSCDLELNPMREGKIYRDSEMYGYFARGWSNLEDWGAWTIGRKSVIGFKIDNPENSDYHLIFNRHCFLSDSNKQLSIKVRINGRDSLTLSCSIKNPQSEFKILVPKRDILDSQGNIFINFDIDTPLSPYKSGVSMDKREIGIGVSSIELRKLN